MSQDIKQLRVKIFDELSKIVDPEIDMSIVELELIDEVDINESDVKVDLHLTSPFCPAVFGFKICQDIHDNLLMVDGVEDVKVNVSNHFMAEQINNQVNNSPKPQKKNAEAPTDADSGKENGAAPTATDTASNTTTPATDTASNTTTPATDTASNTTTPASPPPS